MASGQHSEQPKRSLGRGLLGLVIMVAAVVIFSFLLRTFIFVPYEIPTGSMEDTIMSGDMVFSEKVSYYFREPEQGDIVTFDDPNVEGRTLIKRVVAVGGQEVDLRDGAVYVDGQKLDEPYTDGKESWPLDRTSLGQEMEYPYQVPEGCLWVMGDNRTGSQDSRYFGAIDASTVGGRAIFIYMPLDHIGLLS